MRRNVLTNTAVVDTAKKRKNSVHIIVEHEYVGKKSAEEMFEVIASEQISEAIENFDKNIRKAG